MIHAPPTFYYTGPIERTRADALPISNVTYIKPMLLAYGGWPMAAGPASRLGSFEPGDKTGLRL